MCTTHNASACSALLFKRKTLEGLGALHPSLTTMFPMDEHVLKGSKHISRPTADTGELVSMSMHASALGLAIAGHCNCMTVCE